jgi:hypothetical protein
MSPPDPQGGGSSGGGGANFPSLATVPNPQPRDPESALALPFFDSPSGPAAGPFP